MQVSHANILKPKGILCYATLNIIPKYMQFKSNTQIIAK